MNKVISDFRRFLFTCSGEDNYILKRCNNSMQVRFALIGFWVVVIFLGCFISAGFFFFSLFQNSLWFSMPLGIFFGALVVNIYLLLLHTISPAIIPLSVKKKRWVTGEIEETKSENHFLTVSMFLRIGFMMLLAIIIAQPLNVHLLSNSVSSGIEKHKVIERVKLYMANNSNLIKEELENQIELNQKIKFLASIQNVKGVSNNLKIINTKIDADELFVKQVQSKLNQLNKIENCSPIPAKLQQDRDNIIRSLDNLLNNELDSDAEFIKEHNSISSSETLKTVRDFYKNKLLRIINEKRITYNMLNEVLKRNNFYVTTIQLLLQENPISWLLTGAICLIFLLPIIFKYKVRDLSAQLFAEKDYDEDIKRLRAELINTTDFDWLEEKIKLTNIHDIRTSDYYFQRMLIEHKIILEEYDTTKKQFSEILTEKIKQYNENSRLRLQPLLNKLKLFNPKRYQEYKSQIDAEYKDEVILKYEYWLDMPFRTKRVHTVAISNTEVGLLDFVYNRFDEDEPTDEI